MAPDRCSIYDATPDVPQEYIPAARRAVERAISDPDECREILMMLGIEPADFSWITLPGQRGDTKRTKVDLEGRPYNTGDHHVSAVSAESFTAPAL